MALIGNNADTLLNGLSAFWHRFFRDLSDIQAAYEGAEIQLGQVYLNFMSDVLNTSIVEAPLFRKEFYKLITIREDQIVFREQGTGLATPPLPTFYGNPGTDRYVYTSNTFFNGIPQLQDTIFSPKAALAEGVDYRALGAEIQFKIDPTTPVLPGYAHRRITVGIGGKFTSATTNWISAGVQKGDTLYYSDSTNLNPIDPVPTNQQSAGFLSWLALQNDTRKATIVHVTSDKLAVALDTPLAVFPDGALPAGFSWRIMRLKDDGLYNVTLPRSPLPVNIPPDQAPFTDGQIEYASTLEVSELSFWAVDARIDDLTIYKTYGHAFTNQQLSSESYRSLVRGLMQLYILGPAMARLESALNLTAGLSTIREEDEVLVSYDSGILDDGITGELLAGDIFKVPTSIFSQASVGGYIKITASDFATNVGTFNIITYLSPTQVKIVPTQTFTPDTGLVWVYTKTNSQFVTTSQNTYEYSLETPIRDDVKDSANNGILTFRAFESVTSAIQVTDYVQDPEWWHSITIPPEIWPDKTGPQRSSTPQVYPNILGPVGNATIGDPGFYVGRDEESGNLQQGATGSLTTFNEFDTPYNTFSLDSVGAYVEIYSANDPANVGVWQIASFVSPTRVVLTGFTATLEYKSVTWGYFKGHIATNPYRHNAAFILLDRFMKFHLFAVLVDPSVRLTGLLVTDLKKILNDVKPVHTALYFKPLTAFNDTVHLNEEFAQLLIARKIEELLAIDNDLRIGSTWNIGDTWKFLNPVGGVLDINPGTGGIFAAIGGTDPAIQPADPTNTPPGSAPDLRWIDRPLYAFMHP